MNHQTAIKVSQTLKNSGFTSEIKSYKNQFCVRVSLNRRISTMEVAHVIEGHQLVQLLNAVLVF